MASVDRKASISRINVESGAWNLEWARVGPSTVAEPLLLPHWGQGSELFAVTKAGSGMPCGEGLTFLWDLDGEERESRGRVGKGGKGAFQLAQGWGGNQM